MEDELFMTRGILALLPEDMMKDNVTIEVLMKVKILNNAFT
jgi:hypothetical protein